MAFFLFPSVDVVWIDNGGVLNKFTVTNATSAYNAIQTAIGAGLVRQFIGVYSLWEKVA